MQLENNENYQPFIFSKRVSKNKRIALKNYLDNFQVQFFCSRRSFLSTKTALSGTIVGGDQSVKAIRSCTNNGLTDSHLKDKKDKVDNN